MNNIKLLFNDKTSFYQYLIIRQFLTIRFKLFLANLNRLKYPSEIHHLVQASNN